MSQILVFGASSSEGYWNPDGGWVAKLKKVYIKRSLRNRDFWCSIRNLSISGNTATDLLERFDNETDARFSAEEGNLVIIFDIGKNDSAYVNKIGHPSVSDAKFRKNINTLIKRAKKYTKTIIFLTITPVDEKEVYHKPFIFTAHGEKLFYSNSRITKFNSILYKSCKEQNVNFIDTFTSFKKAGYEKLLFDGLHLNSSGHDLVFKIVRRFLAQKKYESFLYD